MSNQTTLTLKKIMTLIKLVSWKSILLGLLAFYTTHNHSKYSRNPPLEFKNISQVSLRLCISINVFQIKSLHSEYDKKNLLEWL